MFCYSGLNENEVNVLRNEHHIYAARDGRINIAGLNGSNVDYVATAFAAVRSRSQSKL